MARKASRLDTTATLVAPPPIAPAVTPASSSSTSTAIDEPPVPRPLEIMADEPVCMLGAVELEPHPQNPRTPDELDLKHPEMQKLRGAIAVLGQSTPVLARILENDTKQIILGHRRWIVLADLGRPVMTLLVTLSDEHALALMLQDNEVHAQANPLLDADAVAGLVEKIGIRAAAAQLGIPVGAAALRANLATLEPSLRKRWLAQSEKDLFARWEPAQLAELAKISPERQVEVVKHRWQYQVPRSVAEIRRDVEELVRPLKDATWDLADATLVPKAGSCAACPKTSLRCPGLFEDVELDAAPRELKNATCRDGGCWKEKGAAQAKAKLAEVRKEDPKAQFLAQHTGHGSTAPKDAVNAYDVRPVKKGTAGAIPVVAVEAVTFHVAGKSKTVEAGEVAYVVKGGDSTSARTKKEKAKPRNEVPYAERLKSSKNEIELRRKGHVVGLVQEAIRDVKTPASRAVVMGFVAAYDLEHVSIYGPNKAKREEAFATASGKALDWDDDVMERLREPIADSLGYNGLATVNNSYQAAVWLSEILKLDLMEFQEAAKEKIPDPKWWSTEKPTKAGKKPAKKDHAAAAANDDTHDDDGDES